MRRFRHCTRADPDALQGGTVVEDLPRARLQHVGRVVLESNDRRSGDDHLLYGVALEVFPLFLFRYQLTYHLVRGIYVQCKLGLITWLGYDNK